MRSVEGEYAAVAANFACQAGKPAVAADILTSDQPLEQAKAFALLSGLIGKMKFAPSGQQYETRIPVNC